MISVSQSPLGTYLQLTQYPVQTCPSIHRRASYTASLLLVADIDEDLTSGRRHFRSRAGVLLTSLDQVVRAILDGELAEAEAA